MSARRTVGHTTKGCMRKLHQAGEEAQSVRDTRVAPQRLVEAIAGALWDVNVHKQHRLGRRRASRGEESFVATVRGRWIPMSRPQIPAQNGLLDEVYRGGRGGLGVE